MKNLLGIVILSALILACSFGEKEVSETNKTNSDNTVQKATPKKTVETQKSVRIVDVPKLADKSPKAFDEMFGESVKITEIKDNPSLMPGEYREYKVSGHPKNLSVRFYKNKAKRFNLLLGKSEKNASDSLDKIFKIDVGKMQKIKSESLSETWRGKSGGINFKTAYAKRDKAGGDFVMLHAEIQN